MAQPVLSTHRLVLTPLADEHLEDEVVLDSDPVVMRYIAGRARTRDETELAHLRRKHAADDVPGLGFWVGTVDGVFVGWWILQPPNGPDQPRVPGEAELGYRLIRHFWRRNLASEGSKELLRYGFADLGLDRIFAQTMAANVASRATMNAVGMTFARSYTSAGPYDDPVVGAQQGEVEYAISRAEWARGRADDDDDPKARKG